ncbi:MAG TPA: hypothetical protein VKU44_10110, partial [Terriglobia bacterium]|nr:hypothetical protein [Terriglobia bacterium]
AYAALAGLYDADLEPQASLAFAGALGGGTIGERVAKPVDRQQQLAGEVWFYYGSCYGEYLGLTNRGDAEDYLPSALEGTPANADAYFTLAEYYREKKDFAPALADYRHALELDPLRGNADDRIAAILWDQGKQNEAEAQWKSAVAAFTKAEDKRFTPAWWGDVRATLDDIGRHGGLSPVRAEADQLLRTYIQRNGSYNVEPLLEGAMAASSDPTAGVEWIIDLSRAAANRLDFLGGLVNARWIPKAQRELVFESVLRLAEQQLAATYGAQRSYAQTTLDEWRIQWITYLVDTQQATRAEAAVRALPDDVLKSHEAELAPLEVRIAARTRTLDALLEGFRRQPGTVPSHESLSAAATTLRSEGDADSARRVLEFAYTRALSSHDLKAENFLGLAEIRLENGQVNAALVQLRRMTLVAGLAFENLPSAADLLERNGHSLEAVEFRAAFVKASPWDLDARRRLAEDQLTAGLDQKHALESLTSIAGASEASYASRVAAATRLGSGKAVVSVKTGSTELDLLAAGSVDAAAAEKPYFHFARLEAARHDSQPAHRVRLLLGTLAIAPSDEAPRLPLFRAAMDTRRDQLAVLALEPLLQPGAPERALRSAPYRPHVIEDFAAGTCCPGEDQSGETAAGAFLPGSQLALTERARLARELAEAYKRLDLLDQAMEYFRVANEIEPSEATRAELKRQIDSLSAENERRALNELRRPVVTLNLTQAKLVRPRLTAGQGDEASH